MKKNWGIFGAAMLPLFLIAPSQNFKLVNLFVTLCALLLLFIQLILWFNTSKKIFLTNFCLVLSLILFYLFLLWNGFFPSELSYGLGLIFFSTAIVIIFVIQLLIWLTILTKNLCKKHKPSIVHPSIKTTFSKNL